MNAAEQEELARRVEWAFHDGRICVEEPEPNGGQLRYREVTEGGWLRLVAYLAGRGYRLTPLE